VILLLNLPPRKCAAFRVADGRGRCSTRFLPLNIHGTIKVLYDAYLQTGVVSRHGYYSRVGGRSRRASMSMQSGVNI